MGFKVMAERCDQCLFDAENRIVDRSRAAEVLKTCAREDRHFICHKATIEGEDVCCRAFYDSNPGATNLMRVAGRLGAVEHWSPAPSPAPTGQPQREDAT